MSHRSPAIEAIEAAHARKDIPEFRTGDKVKVHALISEGNKERIQVFEGVCIHKSRRGSQGTFTVRKVSDGIGVERVWNIGSPRVAEIELVSRGRVRRSKLYYLRERSGNSARIREKVGDYKENIERFGADKAKKKKKKGKKGKKAKAAAAQA